MTEAATLRKLRSANAKLMKTNLTLLLTDRESDAEMQELTEQLKECAREMEARGIAMPPKYALLLQGGGGAGLQEVDKSSNIEQHNPEQSKDGRGATPANAAMAESSSTPVASSVVTESESAAADRTTPAVPIPEDRDNSDSSDDDSSSDEELA